MLITAATWRCSFSGSLTFLVLAAGFLWGNLHGIAVDKLTAGRVIALVLCIGIALFVVGGFRLGRVRRNGRLVVHTLFGSLGVNRDACAFGISVTYAARGGATYTVYAADSAARAEFADFWTQRGAERGLRRLKRCFCSDADSSRRASAQARVDEDQGRWESNAAMAQQEVNAYYASGKQRRAAYWILGVVIVYTVVMFLISWLNGMPR